MKKALLLLLPMLLAAAHTLDCRDEAFATLEGKLLKLSQLEGKRVLMVFWTTWCPWCRKQMEQLKQFYKEHKEELVVLAVSLDKDKERVESFVKEKKLSFLVIHDEKRRLSACYGGIRAFPTLLILDEKLNLQRRFTGFVHRDILEAELFSSFQSKGF